jgi:hypothetical protein
MTGQRPPASRVTIENIWRKSDDQPPRRSWVSVASYVLLWVLACGAIILLVHTVQAYIASVRTVGGLTMEITSLRFVDDDNPRLLIRFRISNRSPLAIRLNEYRFTVQANGQNVGWSISQYLGTDTRVDPELYKKAMRIEKVLPGRGHLDLDFTLYVYSDQAAIVRRARQAGAISWRVPAEFDVTMPTSERQELIDLAAGIQE